MNVKTQKLLLFSAVLLCVIVPVTAYAQTDTQTETVTTINHGIAFASFIAAGAFYSLSGYRKKLRSVLLGTVKFDYKKFARQSVIGVALGIGAFVFTTYNGDTIAIHTMQDFFVQVGLNMAAILVIDKWLLGSPVTVANNVKNDIPEVEAEPILNYDDEDAEDQKEELPPGKGMQ